MVREEEDHVQPCTESSKVKRWSGAEAVRQATKGDFVVSTAAKVAQIFVSSTWL